MAAIVVGRVGRAAQGGAGEGCIAEHEARLHQEGGMQKMVVQCKINSLSWPKKGLGYYVLERS